MLNKVGVLKDQVTIFALDTNGATALNEFWKTDIGNLLHGGLYIAGTLAVIFAAFTSIKRFAKGSDTMWQKIQPIVFAAVFATFCVKPELANTLINAFSGGISGIANTISDLLPKSKSTS